MDGTGTQAGGPDPRGDAASGDAPYGASGEAEPPSVLQAQPHWGEPPGFAGWLNQNLSSSEAPRGYPKSQCVQIPVPKKAWLPPTPSPPATLASRLLLKHMEGLPASGPCTGCSPEARLLATLGPFISFRPDHSPFPGLPGDTAAAPPCQPSLPFPADFLSSIHHLVTLCRTHPVLRHSCLSVPLLGPAKTLAQRQAPASTTEGANE